jgi:hypothetical protein
MLKNFGRMGGHNRMVRPKPKSDIEKALWVIESYYYLGQGLVIGLIVTLGILLYFSYVGYFGIAILYVTALGIVFACIHSYLRYRTLLEDPSIYSDNFENELERTWFKHPFKSLVEAVIKDLKILIYEWYLILFMVIMFVVSGKKAPIEYFIQSFFLGLGIYGIFLFVSWRYWIRPKINKKYGTY